MCPSRRTETDGPDSGYYFDADLDITDMGYQVVGTELH